MGKSWKKEKIDYDDEYHYNDRGKVISNVDHIKKYENLRNLRKDKRSVVED